MGHKEGTVSDDQYIRTYLSLMRQSYIAHQDWWRDLLGRDKIILVCYCTHGVSFCHRYILAEIFERLGGEIVGEILDPEEPPVPIPRLAASHFEPAIRDRSGNPVIQGKTLAFTGHRPNPLGGYMDGRSLSCSSSCLQWQTGRDGKLCSICEVQVSSNLSHRSNQNSRGRLICSSRPSKKESMAIGL